MDEHVVAREVSFGAFYEVELGRQVRLAALVLGSSSVAQDAVHDAFIEVYRRWDVVADPGPYLQRAVLNRCRDLLRRDSVARRRLPWAGHEVLDGPEEDRELFDALAKLPFNHRAAVVLRYYLQYSEAEIAQQLGCRPGSVGPWIRRGLDRLARDLRLPPEAS